ncbi:LysE family translocator [Labrys monachus]|uniref:Threonine/homoserine/homoserine lactone efflux protein n=1 Tax=Labrys monachus TaxID=217067 RepID=A0ABU0FKV8_9HYPH|nr:LysE family transporter [Labrys monachus]MDQ0395242.1 threonine/homoserine/homoserine lactone efflux protein [Labrys monachus]
MIDASLAFATFLAGFIYTIAPGPAFLALFALGAAKGRGPGAWFMAGHLVGDVLWSVLALAAIIGVSQVGPALFDVLGICCGLYLIYMGARAVMTSRDGKAAVIGAERPLVNGIFFGLTNPKSYPVALATFGALVAPHGSQITWSDTPALIVSALFGFLAAYAILYCAIGLPPVRRFFSRYGVWVTRVVGVVFIGFGAKSLADGARGLASARG